MKRRETAAARAIEGALAGAAGGALFGGVLGAVLVLARGGVVRGVGPALALLLFALLLHSLIGACAGALLLSSMPWRRRVAMRAPAIGALVAAALASRIAARSLAPLPLVAAVGLLAIGGALLGALAARARFASRPRLALLAALIALATWQLEAKRETAVVAANEVANEVAAVRPSRPPPPGFVPPRHLLLVVIDTLRADHLSCYGYGRHTSPQLDAFAASGVQCLQAVTARPSTAPSVASLFTGTWPSRHGIVAEGSPLPVDCLTLAEQLAGSGFFTTAFVANPTLASPFQFDQGFHSFEFVGHSWQERASAAAVNARVCAALAAWPDQRTFTYVHYLDPHHPYEPPSEGRDRYVGDAWWGRERHRRVAIGDWYLGEIKRSTAIDEGSTDLDLYVARYDAAIAAVDEQVGVLLQALDAAGRRDDTLVVVMGDHGESMTERNVFFNHGLFAYDNNVRVPLLLRAPSLLRAGVAFPELVQGVDLMPTLLDLLGVEVPDGLDGRSMAGELLAGDLGRTAAVDAGAPSDALPADEPVAWIEAGKDPSAFITGVRTRRFKLLHHPTLLAPQEDARHASVLLSRRQLVHLWEAAHGAPGATQRWELYDLAVDPQETHNLVLLRPELFQEMRRRHAAESARHTHRRPAASLPRDELSRDRAAQLEALGYGR